MKKNRGTCSIRAGWNGVHHQVKQSVASAGQSRRAAQLTAINTAAAGPPATVPLLQCTNGEDARAGVQLPPPPFLTFHPVTRTKSCSETREDGGDLTTTEELSSV
ncbi:hypothetical protein MHYP_G00061990 [Metynnis hypsauchen]